MIVGIFMLPLSGSSTTVLSQKMELPPMANATQPQAVFSQQFELKANRNVRIRPMLRSAIWADLDVT